MLVIYSEASFGGYAGSSTPMSDRNVLIVITPINWYNQNIAVTGK